MWLSRMIVDGQVVGGVVEGIANAFLTEMIHDDQGQPLTANLADYLAIGATDAPTIRLSHIATRPGTNPLGIRGAGEGGTIAPPAAIFNAIARIAGPGTAAAVVPMTPPRVLAALAHRDM
jgi:carbon-monoxide dehydrogenase large subunit